QLVLVVEGIPNIFSIFYGVFTAFFAKKENPYPFDTVIRRFPGRHLGHLGRNLLSLRTKYPHVIGRMEFSFGDGQSEQLWCSFRIIFNRYRDGLARRAIR